MTGGAVDLQRKDAFLARMLRRLPALGMAAVALSASLSAGEQPAPARGTPERGSGPSGGPPPGKVPAGSILVRGAWPSATDSTTPVPEGGRLTGNLYTNRYFRLDYAMPDGWTQKYDAPPPSETGYYVLAQITPPESGGSSSSGSVLITAQDLFFSLVPAANALEVMQHAKDRLQAELQLDRPLAVVGIGRHSFARFDYSSPVAQLHWYVVATQIRCHAVQFVFTGRDPGQMERLVHALNRLKLPVEADPSAGSGGNDVPLCIKDYARGDNVIQRVDPVLAERRFNAIPVRLVIDKKGRVKHVHFLSAFPEQAKGIADALARWRFAPYMRDRKPIEIETGIMFGFDPRAGRN